MTVLLLPIPPTSNNLFPTGRDGRRFISPEYKGWLTQAGYEVNRQRPEKHPGPVQAVYQYGRYPDKRRRDVANREKGVSDLLVKYEVISDDCMIQRLIQEWSDHVPPGSVRVTIEDWPQP